MLKCFAVHSTEGTTRMNTEGLLWLIVPFLVVVVYFVLRGVKPGALKLSRRSTYAVATVVIALVIVYTVWNYLYR